MKRDTMKRGDKGEKKLFGAKVDASKKLVELDDEALRQVTGGYQCGGIGIPN